MQGHHQQVFIGHEVFLNIVALSQKSIIMT